MENILTKKESSPASNISGDKNLESQSSESSLSNHAVASGSDKESIAPNGSGGEHISEGSSSLQRTIQQKEAPTSFKYIERLPVAARRLIMEQIIKNRAMDGAHLDLSDLPHLPEESFFSQISGNVYRLDLSNSRLDDKTFGFIAQYLGDSIKELNCSRSALTAAGIAQHIGKFKVLEKLDFTYSYTFNDAGFTALADNCSHLKELRCVSQTLSAEAMEKSFPKLKELEVLHIWNNHLNGDVFSVIGTKCTKIRDLKIGSTGPLPSLNAESIALHIGKYKNLQAFEIFADDHFTDDCLVALAESCLNLKELEIHSSLVTAKAIAKNIPRLKQLERLAIWRDILDNNAFVAISSCPKLKSLYISSGIHLTVDGVIQGIGNLKFLESFELHGNVLNDAVLSCLADKVPGLKKLVANGSLKELTSAGMAEDLPKFVGLKEFVSFWLDGMNDEVFEALSDHCKNLEDITISGCDLTATGVAKNIGKFRSLKQVKLDGACVTGPVLRALLEGSKNTLRSIEVDANYVTDEELSLLHQFPRMRHLTIHKMKESRLNSSAKPIIQELLNNGCRVFILRLNK